MGDVVNVAARLMAAAEPRRNPGGRVNTATHRGAVRISLPAPVEVKGKTEPLVAFELTAELSEPSGRLTDWHAPLIGRDEELAQLLRRVCNGAFGVDLKW